MSAIIPWTDPGGTPCCCVTCQRQELLTTWREVELTQQEYAVLYAGGKFTRTYVVSAALQYNFSCSLSGSGTTTSTIDYVLAGCSLASGGSLVTVSENITTSTTCGTQLNAKQLASGIQLQLRIFDDGPTYQYGMQVRISSGQHLFAVSYKAGLGVYSAIILQDFSTNFDKASDNQTINFVIGGRSISIPYFLGSLQGFGNSGGSIVSKSISVSSDTFEFVPSAP